MSGASEATPAAVAHPAPPVLDSTGATGGQYVCPECMAVFRPKVGRQMFCCADHKRAWHNRAVKRGAVLFTLVMAARVTRDGTRGDKDTGKRASWQGNTLMQRWRDEDSAAGRMAQVDYLRRRFALGFDAI